MSDLSLAKKSSEVIFGTNLKCWLPILLAHKYATALGPQVAPLLFTTLLGVVEQLTVQAGQPLVEVDAAPAGPGDSAAHARASARRVRSDAPAAPQRGKDGPRLRRLGVRPIARRTPPPANPMLRPTAQPARSQCGRHSPPSPLTDLQLGEQCLLVAVVQLVLQL